MGYLPDVGKFFVVSARDALLLGDLLWCSLKHPLVACSLRQRARYLHVRLIVMRQRPPVNFAKTKGYGAAQHFLTKEGKLAPWQQLAVLQAMRGWQRYPMWQDLVDLVDTQHLTQVNKLIHEANRYGLPSHRGAHLHLCPSVVRGKGKSFSFEVFASFAPVRQENGGSPSSQRELELFRLQHEAYKSMSI
ncbi:MAG: hypothetical protein V1895_03860 [Parcubacteria group bacterium]